MPYDPLSAIVDQGLKIDDDTIDALRALRTDERFLHPPSLNPDADTEQLSSLTDALLDRLILKLKANPSKVWVMSEFQPVLESVATECTEARDIVGYRLEQIMDIVGIDSSDGMLSFYLGGI